MILNKLLILLGILLFNISGLYAQTNDLINTNSKTLCNPINLSYRFCLDKPSRREAADPTMILFHNEYYLFASKSGGYFHSADMINWDLITTDDLPLEDYAPAAVVLNDSIYFMSSAGAPLKIFKTGDPKSGKWQLVTSSFPIGMIDPDFFVDKDGRLYFYYGCSNINPIYGVELNPKTFMPIGKPVELFNSHKNIFGWERSGDYNDQPENPWIEGAWMTRYKDKYYLQYAGPGTQFKGYCDAVYEADQPLGPFKVAVHNPFSYKPEGYVAGAGHSSTFQDKFGNYWHISTMTISVKHMFERRLGLFPVFFDKAGVMYANTAFGDYPFYVPGKKISGPDEIHPHWMLLSYKKSLEVSSSLPDHPKDLACDEDIRSYWSAATGNKGEWIMMDLGKEAAVNAIQINFAENNTSLFGRTPGIYYQYLLEYSMDKIHWKTIVDKTNNQTDVPHDFLELKKAEKMRYLRLTNIHMPDGTFALSGLRVFGNAEGKAPGKAEGLSITRNPSDPCVVKLSWKRKPGVTGYVVRYGIQKDKLYQSYQVLDMDTVTIRTLNAGQDYYFTLDAFNESGVNKGEEIILVKAGK